MKPAPPVTRILWLLSINKRKGLQLKNFGYYYESLLSAPHSEQIKTPSSKLAPHAKHILFDRFKSLTFDWPFDKHSGFINYAQELVFNKDIGREYLYKAQLLYKKGYDYMAKYQEDLTQYDLYKRTPYKIEVMSRYGQGVFYDFSLAESYFVKTRDIIARNIEWDPQVTATQEYKDLIKNTFKNLITVSNLLQQYLYVHISYVIFSFIFIHLVPDVCQNSLHHQA